MEKQAYEDAIHDLRNDLRLCDEMYYIYYKSIGSSKKKKITLNFSMLPKKTELEIGAALSPFNAQSQFQ